MPAKRKGLGIRSLHRKLVFRLVLMTLVIALLLGAYVYANRRNNLGNAIIARTVQDVGYFNVYASYLFDAPDAPDSESLQRELDLFAQNAPANKWLGDIVMARVFDLKGKVLAELKEDTYSHLKEVWDQFERDPASLDEVRAKRYNVLRVSGAPYVQMVFPLNNSAGKRAADMEIFFAVSPNTVRDLRWATVQAVLIVMGIVIGASVLLYPTIISLMRRQTRLSLQLLDANLETLEVLGSAIAKKDSDTDAHNYRVTIYSVRLAEAVGLEAEEIRTIIKGAFLHDVGKIGIEDKILLKPGRLDEAEFGIMKTHVKHGVDIVNKSSWLDDALQVVSYHHEKFDGSGYYSGLKGEEIPIAARIFAIADVFDALMSRRPYKEPLSFEETMGILEEGAGSHFDPLLVEKFKSIARQLQSEWAGREDDLPKIELVAIVGHFFGED